MKIGNLNVTVATKHFSFGDIQEVSIARNKNQLGTIYFEEKLPIMELITRALQNLSIYTLDWCKKNYSLIPVSNGSYHAEGTNRYFYPIPNSSFYQEERR